MTEPRAALAELIAGEYTYPTTAANSIAADLAERGVLLVTKERLAAAIHAYKHGAGAVHGGDEIEAAAIFAALSAEVTE